MKILAICYDAIWVCTCNEIIERNLILHALQFETLAVKFLYTLSRNNWINDQNTVILLFIQLGAVIRLTKHSINLFQEVLDVLMHSFRSLS